MAWHLNILTVDKMIKDRVNTCVGLALLRCKTTVMIVLLTDLIDLSRLCD